MTEGGELGVDWGGEDDPGHAEASPPEPEAKKLKTQHHGTDSTKLQEEKVLPKEDKEGAVEAKIPDRVMKALLESNSFEEFRNKRVFKFLHVYSGPKDVLATAIKAEAVKERLKCEVTSLDRQLDNRVDMSDAEQHRRLCKEVREGEYDGMHAGFPCGSFSVARWSKNPGPPPVRSTEEIYGLSTNPAERQAGADRGTMMAARSGWLMEAQVEADQERRVPSAATLENPPGDEKCGPAWELPEIKQSLEKVGACKVPFNTCAYQPRAKVRHYKPAMWAGKLEGLPSLSRVCRCPAWIIHEPLVGKAKTERAGRYPDDLCEAVAKLVLAGWKRIIKLEFWRHQVAQQKKAVSEMQHKWLINEEKRFDKPRETKESMKKFTNSLTRALAAETEEKEYIPSSSRRASNKEVKELLNEVAIGGMRNPSKAVARLHMVREVGDQLRREWNAFELEEWDIVDVAVAYGSEEAKFLQGRLEEWETRVVKLWNLREEDREITLKQQDEFTSPLNYELWKEWQRRSRDPDVYLPKHIKNGVPMGMELEIPDSGGVFPKILGAREPEEIPEVEFAVSKETSNYKSVSENLEDARIEIKRYLDKGFAVRKTWDEVEKMFGSGTCSKMALIVKERPDGGKKRRIVIDMKRSQGNARCRVNERITLPRIQDLVWGIRGMVERSEDLKEILYKRYGEEGRFGGDEIEFAMIDLRDAFCHLAVDPREWKHSVTPDEEERGALLWPAMLFGYKAAPLHMGRLAAAIGRLLQSMVSPAEMSTQIYMDDIILVLRGPLRHRNHILAMVLYVLQTMGVQIALEKGERGSRVKWIGTTLELREKELMIGIQSKMLEEIEAELKKWPSMGMIPIREVRRITGKLSWIAGVVPRVKWVVNALYSTMAAVQRDEEEGLEEKRAAQRSDTRPKKGLIPFKRLRNPVDWVSRLLQRKDILLFRSEPFVEKKIQYGLVTDASPLGLGGILIRLSLDGERYEIVEAFEAEFKQEDAKLLNVAHGEASSQSVVETLAVLRGIHKWAANFKGRPILLRSDSTVALGVTKKMGSPSPQLNYLAAEISLMLELHRIQRVVVQHLRGADNKETDWLSRMHDRGDKPRSLEGVKIFRLAPCFTCKELFSLAPPGGEGQGSWAGDEQPADTFIGGDTE